MSGPKGTETDNKIGTTVISETADTADTEEKREAERAGEAAEDQTPEEINRPQRSIRTLMTKNAPPEGAGSGSGNPPSGPREGLEIPVEGPDTTLGEITARYPQLLKPTHLVPLRLANACALVTAQPAENEGVIRARCLSEAIPTGEKVEIIAGRRMIIRTYIIGETDRSLAINELSQRDDIGAALGGDDIYYRFGLTGLGLSRLEDHAIQVLNKQARPSEDPTSKNKTTSELQLNQKDVEINEDPDRIKLPILQRKPAYVGEINIPKNQPANVITLITALIIQRASDFNIPVQVTGHGSLRFLINEEKPRYGIRLMVELYQELSKRVPLNMKLAYGKTTTKKTPSSDVIGLDSDAFDTLSKLPQQPGVYVDEFTGLKATDPREMIYRPTLEKLPTSTGEFKITGGNEIANETLSLRIAEFVETPETEELRELLSQEEPNWITIVAPATYGKTSTALECMDENGIMVSGDPRGAWSGFRQFAQQILNDLSSFGNVLKHGDILELYELTGSYDLSPEEVKKVNTLRDFISGDSQLEPIDIAQALVSGLILRGHAEDRIIQLLLDDRDRLPPFLDEVATHFERIYLQRREEIKNAHVLVTVRDYVTQDGKSHLPNINELRNGEHIIRIRPFQALRLNLEDGTTTPREGIDRFTLGVLKRIGLLDADFEGELNVETRLIEYASKIARFEDDQETNRVGSPYNLRMAIERLAILGCISITKQSDQNLRAEVSAHKIPLIEREIEQSQENEIIPRQIDILCENNQLYFNALAIAANCQDLEEQLFDHIALSLDKYYPGVIAIINTLKERRHIQVVNGNIRMDHVWQENSVLTLSEKQPTKYQEILLRIKDCIEEANTDERSEARNIEFSATVCFDIATKTDDEDMRQKYAFAAAKEALENNQHQKAFECIELAKSKLDSENTSLKSREYLDVAMIYAQAALYAGEYEKAEAAYRIIFSNIQTELTDLERSNMLVTYLQLSALKVLRSRNGEKDLALIDYRAKIDLCTEMIEPERPEALFSEVHRLYLQTLEAQKNKISSAEYNKLINEAENLETRIEIERDLSPDTATFNAFSKLYAFLQVVIQNLHIEKARWSVGNVETALVRHALDGTFTETGVNVSAELQSAIRAGNKGMATIANVKNLGMGLYPEARLATFNARAALETTYDLTTAGKLIELALSYIYDVETGLGGDLISQLQSAVETRLICDAKLQEPQNYQLRERFRALHERLSEIGVQREVLKHQKDLNRYQALSEDERRKTARPTMNPFVTYNGAEAAIYRALRQSADQGETKKSLDLAWKLIQAFHQTYMANDLTAFKSHWHKLLASFYAVADKLNLSRNYDTSHFVSKESLEAQPAQNGETRERVLAVVEGANTIVLPEFFDEYTLRQIPEATLKENLRRAL